MKSLNKCLRIQLKMQVGKWSDKKNAKLRGSERGGLWEKYCMGRKT